MTTVAQLEGRRIRIQRHRPGCRVPPVGLSHRPAGRHHRPRAQRFVGRHDRRVRRRDGARASSSTRCTFPAARGANRSRSSSPTSRPNRRDAFEIVDSERRRAPTGLDSAGSGDLRRLRRRDLRPVESPLSLPVHQLHELRSAVHDRDRHSVRPRARRRWRRSRCVRPAAASTTTSADRRFHAQPNACPVCGPRADGCTPRTAPVSTLTM